MSHSSLRREYFPGTIAYTEPDFEGYRREKDMEFFDKYGYFPEQARANKAAGAAAEAEWRQLVEDLNSQLARIDEDEMANRLREQFMGIASGQNLPYGAGTINELVSQGTDPIMQGAQTGLGRLRESFASRGLGRTGGLGSLEQQMLQQAIAQAGSEAAGIRGRYVGENWRAQETARQGMAGLYGTQQGLRQDIISQLANLRAQRQFDPNQFQGNAARQPYTPAGMEYVPPPDIQRRRVGQSVPRYKATQYDYTGAWATGR